MKGQIIIPNPITGKDVFATIPDIGNSKSKHFVKGGDIYLYEGKWWVNKGTPGGYGLSHIEHKHGEELKDFGYMDRHGIIDFLYQVLQPGSQVYLEENRPIILETHVGIVVLETKQSFDLGTYYHIVSAYNKKTPRGKHIGVWK